MRTITIRVEEDVARWARVRAAERNTSVSRLVGDLLRQRMLDERSYQAAKATYLSQSPVALKESDGYPPREDLHDRDGIR